LNELCEVAYRVVRSNPVLFTYSVRPQRVNMNVVAPYLHQSVLFRQMLAKPVRALITDEIGVGKTIEALLILRLAEFVSRYSSVLSEEDVGIIKELIGLGTRIMEDDTKLRVLAELLRKYISEGMKVEAFTFFMAVRADLDVLDNLYNKLISMNDALSDVRPIFSEKLQMAYRTEVEFVDQLWRRTVEDTEAGFADSVVRKYYGEVVE